MTSSGDDSVSKSELSAENKSNPRVREGAGTRAGWSEKPSAEETLIAQVAAVAEAEKKEKEGGGGKSSGEERERQENDGGEELQKMAQKMTQETTQETTQEMTQETMSEVTAEDRVAELEDRLTRSLAEVENMRRRFEREKRDALRYGASRLAMDVFEVADNLGRACAVVSEEMMERDKNLKNVVVGIRMTEKALGEALLQNDIVTIAPDVGDVFSANEHEAISEVESKNVAEGCVVEVVRRGYRMGERLLRAAQVITAKSKQTIKETSDEEKKN